MLAVFEEDGKYYPQIYLDECLYELKKMIQLNKIEDSEWIDLDKTDKSKECEICHYNYFNNGFKSHSKVCNRCNWRLKSFWSFAIITANGVGYRFFMFDMTEDVIDFVKDFEPDEL